jgi:hypothetical protein
MENTIGSTRQIEETGNYLQLFIYRAPKKNHDAIAKNLMQFVPWFKKNGVRVEYYQLGKSETQGAIDSAKKAAWTFWTVSTRPFPPPPKMRRKFG